MLFLAVYDLPVVIFVKQNKKFETVFVIFIAIEKIFRRNKGNNARILSIWPIQDYKTFKKWFVWFSLLN